MKVPFGSEVLDAVVRIIVPAIFLFGAYVVLHGHYSPGGGFQGGVIFAVAFILLRLVWGDRLRFGPSKEGAQLLASAGLSLFLLIGFLPLFWGGNFLNYGAVPLGASPITVRVILSLGAEIGIAIAVTGVIILIYDSLIEEFVPR